ncbi:hypothetical protein BT96DRAFT_1008277 [Gymnopus androsaceus JB14]|uniref:Uncharacterized protein n=1 Tax=Gymnopus androsaceus JB14 TaxID=1447944 RepID=A0A6A4GFJ4_9AGAR|nr:hypothetical protein BT96DRAFT_1008277 [Gymnopus androsaceus JB14]
MHDARDTIQPLFYISHDKKSHLQAAAAHARAARHSQNAPTRSSSPEIQISTPPIAAIGTLIGSNVPIIIQPQPEPSESEAVEISSWDGTINNPWSEDESGSDWTDSDTNSDNESEVGDPEEVADREFEDLAGDEMINALAAEAAGEVQLLNEIAEFEKLKKDITAAQWAKAEQNQGLGYNGRAD